MLMAYFVLTVTYSLYIKRVALLDVIVLAGLYTLRIMVGSAAVAIWPSPWLVAFSIFLFVSLAFVKRYSELVTMRKLMETLPRRVVTKPEMQNCLLPKAQRVATWRSWCWHSTSPVDQPTLCTAGTKLCGFSARCCSIGLGECGWSHIGDR